jgi:dynein heavy chain
MVDSVRDHCRRSVLAYAETARERWVLEWPGQVVLVVSAVYWTKHCTEAIAAGEAAVAEYEKTCTQQLSQIVSLVSGFSVC